MIRLFDWNLEWVSSTQKSNLAGATYQHVLDTLAKYIVKFSLY